MIEDYPVVGGGIYALMPQRNLVPLRARAFIDFLAARFSDNPPWENMRNSSDAE